MLVDHKLKNIRCVSVAASTNLSVDLKADDMIREAKPSHARPGIIGSK